MNPNTRWTIEEDSVILNALRNLSKERDISNTELIKDLVSLCIYDPKLEKRKYGAIHTRFLRVFSRITCNMHEFVNLPVTNEEFHSIISNLSEREKATQHKYYKDKRIKHTEEKLMSLKEDEVNDLLPSNIDLSFIKKLISVLDCKDLCIELIDNSVQIKLTYQ